ncbi:MAG TPA: exodeoxyribonuclease III [Acidimicrobiia bacterium]
MKVITWNVNSLRSRLPRLRALLERESPDIVCLQETKVSDPDFPSLALGQAGYQVVSHGLGGSAGVAILSKQSAQAAEPGFVGDPLPDQARVVAATVGGIRVVSVYVINGGSLDDPAYQAELEWLDAFTAWLKSSHDPRTPLIVAGDFNVAPDDRDVHDPSAWTGRIHVSEAERARIRSLFDWGLVDLLRVKTVLPGFHTWWDYRAGAFHRGWGLRIDLILATRPVAELCTEVHIDRNERRPTAGEGKPSDHAPVIAELRFLGSHRQGTEGPGVDDVSSASWDVSDRS